MQNKHQPLNPGYFYHIYSRGNNREKLFYKSDNYIYFLKKYDQYLNDYLETYAFCLLPNHFHLLVRVKKVETDAIPPRDGILTTPDKIIAEQFRRFFISYSQAINKQQNRVGSLFQKNFKRICIENRKYLTNLIYYIHANSQIHELIDDFRNWPYSSYGKFLEAKKSHLKKEDVLSWFGRLEEYKTYHSMVHNMKKTRRFQIEE